MPTGTPPKANALRSWARKEAKAHSTLSPTQFAAAVASHVGDAVGLKLELDGVAISEPPGGWSSPWLVGVAHEQAASAAERTDRGAWYTPRSVVEGLVALALSGDLTTPEFVVDPTCGGGAFLLAALDHMVAAGLEPSDALGRVGGIDIDAGAVEAATLALSLWAAQHGTSVRPNIQLGDALVSYPDDWPQPQVVIGNPPFASPLKTDAVGAEATDFRNSRPELFGPYADLASYHLARATELVRDDGAVCMVLPMSVVSGRDTEGLRARLASEFSTTGFWCTRKAVFDAGVRVVAPVISAKTASKSKTALATGADVNIEGASGSLSWSDLAADALGVPGVKFKSSAATLGELVQPTAGFRDEHYGLAEACVEAAQSKSQLRLTTVGSIDPLFGWWGHRQTRFAGTKWDKPVIETDKLNAKVGRWVENQCRPKVVLPTQSKVLEPLIDLTGNIVPATPVLALHAEEEWLHHVAAVLLCPTVVALAARRSFGQALSVDAVKLAASEVGRLPLPNNSDAWDAAAETLKAAGVQTAHEAAETALAVAEIMLDAYKQPAKTRAAAISWYKLRFPTPK